MGLSSEISVNQGRYRPFYGLCPQTFIQEKSAVNLWWSSYNGSTLACEADGAGSIPVDHPNFVVAIYCKRGILHTISGSVGECNAHDGR